MVAWNVIIKMQQSVMFQQVTFYSSYHEIYLFLYYYQHFLTYKLFKEIYLFLYYYLHFLTYKLFTYKLFIGKEFL